ncbi:hypothetical protein D3C75_528330 [compost metagenome]
MFDVCTHVFVHGNASSTFIELNSSSFNFQTIQVRLPSNSHQHFFTNKQMLTLGILIIYNRLSFVSTLDFDYLRVRMDMNPCLLRRMFNFFRNVAIDHGQQSAHKFDYMDFNTQITIDEGKLHTNDAPADNRDALRQLSACKRISAVHHKRKIDAWDIHLGNFGACSYDDVVRGNMVVVLPFYTHFMCG